MKRLIRLAALAAAFSVVPAFADDKSAPASEPVAERPTLRCIGTYWIIKGDDNRNATVKVEYHKQGETTWHPGPPLFRVVKGANKEEKAPEVPDDAWLFAGSVIGVEPNSKYEIKLTLNDPDGGSASKTIQTETRAEPLAPKTQRMVHVVPGAGGGTGTQADPFKGIAAADKAAKPGDTMLLHKGIYQSDTIQLRKSGEKGKPIIWTSAGDGEAVLDGGGKNIIQAIGLSDIWFENLSLRNSKWAIVTHESARVVLRGCNFTDVDFGITATKNANDNVNDYFVADNVMKGRSIWPRTKETGIEDRRGVQLAGAGHVICNNRISNFGDGIDTFQGPRCEAIDIHNNDLTTLTDDGVETDYSQRNVRVFENRLTNVYQGISTQPIYGGPIYITRNVMYNVSIEPFKMHNGPSGAIMYHNTIVKAGEPITIDTNKKIENCIYRNNLFIGTKGRYAMVSEAKMDDDVDFDYDGFGGGPFGNFLKWNGKRYPNLAAVQKDAPVYKHAIQLDNSKVFATGTLPPETDQKAVEAGKADLRLAQGSAAVDAGEAIPGINDGFSGKAPDLGAYELGSTPPQYGPRKK